MRKMILSLTSCVLMVGCSLDDNGAPSRGITIDQVPPECLRYFRKSAGSNKQMFDKLVAAYDTKRGLTPQECAQLDAETPASN